MIHIEVRSNREVDAVCGGNGVLLGLGDTLGCCYKAFYHMVDY